MKSLNHNETADSYDGVIAKLGEGWRVIVCQGNHQWILQRRRKGGGDWPWKAIGYFRTREALARLTAASGGEIDPSARAASDALPDHFGGA